MLSVLARKRRGEGRGFERNRPKPGRVNIDGVMHYDGTGPSGYKGTCGARTLVSRQVYPIKLDEPFLAGPKSRRRRSVLWVRFPGQEDDVKTLEDLQKPKRRSRKKKTQVVKEEKS